MAIVESFYLLHDIDAFNDIKITALCSEFGLEAYALFWVLLERMFPEEGLSLPYSDLTFMAIKSQSRATLDVKCFIDRAIEYDLFDRDGDVFFSPSLIRRMKALDKEAEEKSEKARQSANARWAKKRDANANTGIADAEERDATVMRTQCDRNANAVRPQCDVMRSDANKTRLDKTRQDYIDTSKSGASLESLIENQKNALEEQRKKDAVEKSEGEPSPDGDVFVELIMRKGNGIHKVTHDDVKEFKSLYPEVDVERELKKMAMWCKDNPRRRKTKAGIRTFILGWLDRTEGAQGFKGNGKRDNRDNFTTEEISHEPVKMPRIDAVP